MMMEANVSKQLELCILANTTHPLPWELESKIRINIERLVTRLKGNYVCKLVK